MNRALAFAALLSACSPPVDPPAILDAPLASGVRVTQVAAYQGLKSVLMKDGAAAAANVPLVAGRALLLRVFVALDEGQKGHDVLVRLHRFRGDAEQPLSEVRRFVGGASTDTDLTSTINFDLAAEEVSEDLAWSVSLHEVVPGVQAELVDGAQFPADGTQQPLGAHETGVVKVVVIPIAWDADGTGRMPSTQPAQLDKLRTRMLQLYPVRDIQLTVGAPMHWKQTVSANGAGWGALLEAVVEKRLDDNVPSDVYYYGLFTPAATVDQYCRRGCVAGLSPASPDPDDELARGSIGLGYASTIVHAEETFVHEVGHAHGRLHAPCGVPDPDPDFPYSDGELGTWAYDLMSKKLIDPAGHTRDMMGYCDPTWISDFTYKALFERITHVNGLPLSLTIGPASRWRVVRVDGDGAVRGGLVSLRRAPAGERRLIERVGAQGTEPVAARYYPFDHVPGGLWFVPEAEDTAALRIEGRLVR